MDPFLLRLAEAIKSGFPDSPAKLCVVLPNRRSGLFLRKFLARVYNRVIWAPDIFTIDDFISEVSGLTITEPYLLLSDLYHSFKTAGHDTNLDSFLSVAHKIIRDFNHVDLYLADPAVLFKYLDQAKAISLWNPDGRPLTTFQKDYLKFFNGLYSIYSNFRTLLLPKHTVYQGLAYRYVAENPELLTRIDRWEKIYFAGFNALSASELKIFSSLIGSDKADLFWNADLYYTENNLQEAGLFLRKNFKNLELKEIKWKDNNLLSSQKNLSVYGASGNIDQVIAMNRILDQWFAEGKHASETVVVLNDEHLLFPVLSFIGQLNQEYNVTMGIPLKASPAWQFADVLFRLYENSVYFTVSGKRKRQVYYYKDLRRLFENRLFRRLQNPAAEPDTLLRHQGKKKVFYYQDELLKILSENTQLPEGMAGLFFPDTTPGKKTILDVIIQCSKCLSGDPRSASKPDETPLLHASMIVLAEATTRISKALENLPDLDDLKVFHRFFNTVAGGLRIPLFGEPLKGLQVMGMLETRAIDFKNVIMLSVNEGHMPGNNVHDSFIPFDISLEFGLPTYRERDAVYAYHFYRLLQHADHVALIYNAEQAKLGSNEKSRFILQLEHELIKNNPEITYRPFLPASANLVQNRPDAIVIEKNEIITERLIALSAEGFSPTALTSFKNCSLRFYFNYVAGIKETEEIPESVDHAMFGEIIHKVLQESYQPFNDVVLNAETHAQIERQALASVDSEFRSAFSGEENLTGRNYLIAGVIKNYLERFFTWEKQEILSKGHTLMILDHERKLSIDFNQHIPDLNRSIPVVIKGKCDRIDVLNGQLRILDYKTGKVKPAELRPDSPEDLISNSKFDKAFQVQVYKWLLSNDPKFSNFRKQEIVSGIIPLRNISDGCLELEYKSLDPVTVENKFQSVLVSLITDLFDQAQSFSQTDNMDYCKFCPFTDICGRKE